MVLPSWFNHSTPFCSSPSSGNHMARQKPSMSDFLVVIEMYIPNPTEISSSVASTGISKKAENYSLCRAKRQCGFFRALHVQEGWVSEDSLPLLPFARYCSPLQGTVLPILPVLAKSRQLHISAFSKDFTFIGLVTNSFYLEQIQVLVWNEKSQENLA